MSMRVADLNVGIVCRNDVDSAFDLANAVHMTGNIVNLYMSYSHTAMTLDAHDGLEKCLYELGLVPPGCKVRFRHIPRMRDPRSIGMVRSLIKTMQQDGVHVAHILMGPGELWLAVLAIFLRKIAVVSTIVIPKPNIGDVLPDWIVFITQKILALGSDLVIVNGATQTALVQKLYQIRADRVRHVPLCPRITAAKWSLDRTAEEPGTVLFFGAARRHKGLEYLIRAQPLITRRVPNACILIASRGPELARCVEMIMDSSKFEIYDGFVPGDVMADLFRRASLVVLPYISASTSGVLLTAYEFGKPVVASNVGCLPEYVDDRATGLLVPPEDVERLADAIIGLLIDDGVRRRMGENARSWVRGRRRMVAGELTRAYESAILIHKHS